jgi:hypothetical protein
MLILHIRRGGVGLGVASKSFTQEPAQEAVQEAVQKIVELGFESGRR